MLVSLGLNRKNERLKLAVDEYIKVNKNADVNEVVNYIKDRYHSDSLGRMPKNVLSKQISQSLSFVFLFPWLIVNV